MNIEDLKGVGPKTAKLLNKLDIYTISDLLGYYPYKYNIYHFNELNDSNENLIVSANNTDNLIKLVEDIVDNIYKEHKMSNNTTGYSKYQLFNTSYFNQMEHIHLLNQLNYYRPLEPTFCSLY